MGRVSEIELKLNIKNGEFANAYLIFGEENYLKEFYVKKIKSKVVNDTFEDFNFRVFESKNSSIDEIIQSAEMLPMMSDYNFVLVHDYPLSNNSNDIEKIKEFLKDIPDTTVIVFWYDSVPFNIKENSKLRGLESAFAKYGVSAELKARSERDLIKLLISGAKKRKVAFSTENASYFISVVGSDIQTLLNEFDKICCFASDMEITKNLIDEIATKCLAAKVYDITKAIVKGDFETAYLVLDSLFEQKEEPIVILAVISSLYVDMYRAKCAKIFNHSIGEILELFNYGKRDFVVKNAMRDSAKLSVDQLRNSVDILSETDLKLKGSNVDKKVALEEALVKLLLISKDAKYA